MKDLQTIRWHKPKLYCTSGILAVNGLTIDEEQSIRDEHLSSAGGIVSEWWHEGHSTRILDVRS